MFNRFSKRIVEHCCKEKSSNEIELYIFGINQGLNMLLNIITALFIGMLFGEVFRAFLFMFSYIPLRSYAGGYHAKTPLRCYLLSLIMLIIVLSGMKYLPVSDLVYYAVLAGAVLIVFLLSPVEDKNKPLDEIEHKVYKKRAVLIAASEVVIGIVFKLIGLENLFAAVAYSFAALSLMLVAGKIKNCFEVNKAA